MDIIRGECVILAFDTLYDDLNVSLLVIDQRAAGESEGVYTSFGALERFDIREWIFYLNGRYNGEKEIYLHGISMGAATSLLVTALAALPPSFKGVVADCGFSRTDVTLLLKRCLRLSQIDVLGIKYTRQNGRRF